MLKGLLVVLEPGRSNPLEPWCGYYQQKMLNWMCVISFKMGVKSADTVLG